MYSIAMRSFYLLIAHGSKRSEGNEGLWTLVGKFKKAYPGRSIEGCFLDIAKPDIPEGIQNCLKQGAQEIFVLPLMLFKGRHVSEDIPRFIEKAHTQYPDIAFHYASPISDHPKLLELLEDQARLLKSRK